MAREVLLKGGVEKRLWLQADRCSVRVGWTNSTGKKSRYVVEDFANTRPPTMFAAASDKAVGRVFEHKAVLTNYSMFTFDVTSAYTMPGRTNLSFWNRHRKRSKSMVIVCGGR